MDAHVQAFQAKQVLAADAEQLSVSVDSDFCSSSSAENSQSADAGPSVRRRKTEQADCSVQTDMDLLLPYLSGYVGETRVNVLPYNVLLGQRVTIQHVGRAT